MFGIAEMIVFGFDFNGHRGLLLNDRFVVKT